MTDEEQHFEDFCKYVWQTIQEFPKYKKKAPVTNKIRLLELYAQLRGWAMKPRRVPTLKQRPQSAETKSLLDELEHSNKSVPDVPGTRGS